MIALHIATSSAGIHPLLCYSLLSSLQEIDSYELDHLDYKTVAQYPYLEGEALKHVYLYHSTRSDLFP